MSISIGFIGLGEHQQRAHLQHLINLKHDGYDLDFIGAFDPRTAAFDEVHKTYGVDLPAFSNVQDLASHSDAVLISSPDQFHGEHLLACVEQGCHVFCEKPMAVSLADIKILREAVGQSLIAGTILATCHPRRFDPPFIWLQETLPSLEAEYGKAQSFDFSFWYHEVTDAWKKNRSLLSDHFGHEIDILRFLFGEGPFKATKVRDSYQSYEVLGVGEDLSFRFFGSRNLKESVYLETMQIDFLKTRLFVNINQGRAIFQPSGAEIIVPKMNYDVRFYQVNKNFIEAILGKGDLYLTNDDILCNNLSSVDLTETGACIWAPSGLEEIKQLKACIPKTYPQS